MNLMFGRHLFGRHRFAAPVKRAGAAVITYPYIPNHFALDFFDSEGIRTATISNDLKASPIITCEFEIGVNGCAGLKLSMQKDHGYEINYGQRIDIRLFGDGQPWYSGYIQTKPSVGTTAETWNYTGYGYFQKLDKVIINQTYENTKLSAIVANMTSLLIEPQTGVKLNRSKNYSSGFTATKLRFDYVSAKAALKQLADFATNYVYGVDEYRDVFFKPLVTAINENSRFWVGHHIESFVPEEDAESVVNFIYVKGGAMDSGGSNIMYECSDAASISAYGKRDAVLTIPSALSAADAQRWGDNELGKLKDPKRTAKVDGIHEEVLRRKVKPEGMARITAPGPLVISTGALTFARNSVAYRSDGAQVAVNEPRFERSLTDNSPLGLKAEEGTTNIFVSSAADFVTGWVKYQSAQVNVTDYPVYILEFGSVIAKRIQTTGGSNALKTYTTVSGRPNPHTDTVSIWGMVLSGAASLRNNLLNPAAFTNTMQRVSSTTPYSGTITQFEFWAATAADNLDIVVYWPQIENKPYVTSPMPPQGVRAAEAPTVPASVIDSSQGTIEFDHLPATTVTGNVYPLLIGTTANYISVFCVAGGNYALWHRKDWGTSYNQASSIPRTSGVNANIKVRWHGNTISLWINGVKRVELTNYAPITLTVGNTVQIGHYAATSNSQSSGNYDNLRISNIARTDTEMAYTGALQWDEYTTLFAPLTDNLAYQGLASRQSVSYDYPIQKVKYKLDKGSISMAIEMGEYTKNVDGVVMKLLRNAKDQEILQQMNNKQLSGGSV